MKRCATLLTLVATVPSVVLAGTPVSAEVASSSNYDPNVFSDVPKAPKNLRISDSDSAKMFAILSAKHRHLKKLEFWKNDWPEKGKYVKQCFYSPMSGMAGTKFWFPLIAMGESVVFFRDCGTADRSQVAVSCGNDFGLISRNYGGDGWSPWQLPEVSSWRSEPEFIADICFYR